MRGFSIIFIAGIALAGLFFLFKPVAPPTVGVEPQPARPAPTVSQAEVVTPAQIEDTAEPDVIGVEIAGGHRVSGPDTVRVKQGDTVRIVFTTDQDNELHLHGYDVTLALSANQPTELALVADIAGRFEYELHGGHHAVIGVLEVYP